MKTIRIIPRLDIKGPNVVKGVHIEGLRVVGNPKELALKYYRDGADEIIYMDIVASLYQRNLDFEQLRSVSDNIFIPITVAGGIRSIGDMNNALRAGADKVAVNTFAVRYPNFLREASHEFGSQCIILSIEAKKTGDNKWEVYTEGGRERTGLDVVEWAKKAIDLGVGEILVTSIDREGTRKGYEKELVGAISLFSPIPVIAHGGAGNLEDIKEVITEAKADAVSLSSLLHYGDVSIPEIKHHMREGGINVRIS